MLVFDLAQKNQTESSIRMSRGTGFFKSSIPGALSTVLENVRPRFSQPDWLPLGLRRYNRNSQHRKESGFFTVGCPVTWTFHPQIYSDIWTFSQVFEVFLQIFDNSNGIFLWCSINQRVPRCDFYVTLLFERFSSYLLKLYDPDFKHLGSLCEIQVF